MTLELALPDGSTRSVEVHRVFNAGYAGRAQEEVAAHVAELAELGVPAPDTVPALYPVSPYLASQTDRVPAQHDRTSGEAECALVVGDDVTIGHHVVLHACTIGNRVLVGMGSIVMDQVVIEDDVLLAAGSLVPPGKRLESGHLYRGSPATKARALSAQEREQLLYSAAHYVRVKNRHASG